MSLIPIFYAQKFPVFPLSCFPLFRIWFHEQFHCSRCLSGDFCMKHEDSNDKSVVRNHNHSSVVCSFFQCYSASPNKSFMFPDRIVYVTHKLDLSPLHSFINNFLAQSSFIAITKVISSGTISYYLHFHVNQDSACLGNKIATFIALFLIK